MKPFFKRYFPVIGPFWAILISLVVLYILVLMAIYFRQIPIDWMWAILALPGLCMVALVARDIINNN
jgi:hypothetical protein